MNESDETKEIVQNEIEEENIKEKKKKEKKSDKEKEELKQTILTLNEKLLRVTAEMQNVKRRSEMDLSNAYKYDGIDLVEKLLPVVDNFERALQVKIEGADKFLSGFKMIYDQLVDILKTKGIEEIKALDMPFDPTHMNAVLTEANNEKENNIVLDVLQKGYLYNDKIIRPAMVKVNERESE